jgi:predicted metal-dependent hydrolase
VLLTRPAAAARSRVVHIAGRSLEVEVRRHPGARRYTLRLASDGRLRLTVPRWASISEGLRFVAGQAAWIQRERLRQAVRHAPWRHGTTIWHRGARTMLTVSEGWARFGTPPVSVPISSPDVRDAVETHLRAEAVATLPARCLELADRHGLSITSVRVRNQRSRWGACSARGAITLNWRLIQMPSAVADYVILHELMHLKQPNHSRRFWREVAAVCPEWREAERWLRTWGKEML